MSRLTLQTLGRRLLEKRAERSVRVVAREIGISPATLSRVERGHLPDLDTFRKVCTWLEVDAGEALGVKTAATSGLTSAVHFRKEQSLSPKTAGALAEMILAAQRAIRAIENQEGGSVS